VLEKYAPIAVESEIGLITRSLFSGHRMRIAIDAPLYELVWKLRVPDLSYPGIRDKCPWDVGVSKPCSKNSSRGIHRPILNPAHQAQTFNGILPNTACGPGRGASNLHDKPYAKNEQDLRID